VNGAERLELEGVEHVDWQKRNRRMVVPTPIMEKMLAWQHSL